MRIADASKNGTRMWPCLGVRRNGEFGDVFHLHTGDAPDPEHVSRLPAVWDTDEDGGVGKDMALRNGKDLID